MKKVKIFGRILVETFVFTIPFLWAPLWIQFVVAIMLSLALEWYRSTRRQKRLRDAINKIDFTALQQHHSNS